MQNLLVESRGTSFPVSIGTGLSLETLFPTETPIDDSRIFKKLENLSTYNLYAFNIATLLRNIITSVSFKDLVGVSKKQILETLLDEIDFITNFFQSNDLHVKFYINSYSYAKNAYKDKIRIPTTDHQFFIEDINKYCLNSFKKEDDVTHFSKNIHFNRDDSVLVMTHVAFDLLSYSNFHKLDLLESHTGLIKSRKEFNSKYYPLPNRDMSFLPFMEYLLTIFGDKVLFSPAPLKERIDLYNAMLKKGVNPLTSELSFSFLKNNM